jgi:hypothetical protein
VSAADTVRHQCCTIIPHNVEASNAISEAMSEAPLRRRGDVRVPTNSPSSPDGVLTMFDSFSLLCPRKFPHLSLDFAHLRPRSVKTA